MKKLALPLSLLALGGLGLTACDDDESTAASEADPARKSCRPFSFYRLAVNEGDISCRAGRRVILDLANNRLPGSWSCTGQDADVVCTKEPGASSRIVITARFAGEGAAVDTDSGNNRLSNEERIEQRGNLWAAAFAADGNTCRFMGQPACGREGCERIAGPITNCTPPSPEYRESFADATVERVVIDGHHATAEFSNGESVEFDGQKADEGDKAVAHSAWFIPETWVKEIARRNFEA